MALLFLGICFALMVRASLRGQYASAVIWLAVIWLPSIMDAVT